MATTTTTINDAEQTDSILESEAGQVESVEQQQEHTIENTAEETRQEIGINMKRPVLQRLNLATIPNLRAYSDQMRRVRSHKNTVDEYVKSYAELLSEDEREKLHGIQSLMEQSIIIFEELEKECTNANQLQIEVSNPDFSTQNFEEINRKSLEYNRHINGYITQLQAFATYFSAFGILNEDELLKFFDLLDKSIKKSKKKPKKDITPARFATLRWHKGLSIEQKKDIIFDRFIEGIDNPALNNNKKTAIPQEALSQLSVDDIADVLIRLVNHFASEKPDKKKRNWVIGFMQSLRGIKNGLWKPNTNQSNRIINTIFTDYTALFEIINNDVNASKRVLETLDSVVIENISTDIYRQIIEVFDNRFQESESSVQQFLEQSDANNNPLLTQDPTSENSGQEYSLNTPSGPRVVASDEDENALESNPDSANTSQEPDEPSTENTGTEENEDDDPNIPDEPNTQESESDLLYDEAVNIVTESRRASISYLQRRLKVGYNRAATMIEDMEKTGVVSAVQSNGTREVLAPAPDNHEE
jgi:hypothetical protein